MIAVDTNVLVYAHRADSAWHVPAAETVRSLAEGRASWAIPWACLHEFLAIVTHPRIYDPPTPLDRALDQVDAWLESPTLSVISEGDGYWRTMRPIVAGSQVLGPRVHDARVVALCRRHGVRELLSADRDFGRFKELTVRNPLVG